MSIKHHLGKQPEAAILMDAHKFESLVKRLGATELLISHKHTRMAGQISVSHKDPFDRLLAAQALLEGINIISKDGALDNFPITRVWN